MKTCTLLLSAAFGFIGSAPGTSAIAQSTSDAIDAHVAAARKAAGREYLSLLLGLCLNPRLGPSTAPPAATPDPATWHREPVKVFDNLYFVGTVEHGAWAVTTSGGIILVDTIYDYNVEGAVAGGLRKLGLDPAQIKYAIVSHGHRDHAGGARYLQDKFGTRVLLSAADWDFLEQSPRVPVKPKRDMVVTDGQKLTLGDTTVVMYHTPGHTPGSISTLIPVKDGGKRHLAAIWGGTGFNFDHTPENFRKYIASAQRFSGIVRTAGADVHIANHTNQDGSKVKLPAVLARKAGDPHPYVIGTDSVLRFLKVAEECAKAAELRLK